jgi:hypothetical protein
MFGVLFVATRASELVNLCGDIALTGAASNQSIGSTDQTNSAKKTSRVETIFARLARRNPLHAFNFGARSPYHYYRVKGG